MGSKSRLLDVIFPLIMSVPGIDTVVDLFAGTGVVGYALKGKKKVISNDLEYYSYIINSSILNGCDLSDNEICSFFGKVKEIQDVLESKLSRSLAEENKYLFECDDYFKYAEYISNTPSVFNLPDEDNVCFSDLSTIVSQVKAGCKLEFPCLFTTYYANTYFGLRQCCQIDAIRSVIDGLRDTCQRNVMLTALMSVMSSVSSTTTHFAQYLKVNGSKSYESLIQKRKRNIIIEFQEVLHEFRKQGLLSLSGCISECYNLDYMDCLDVLKIDSSTLVYADPPYFKEHYSRYYHILNTVCLYDYPDLCINHYSGQYTVGRYRSDRNISDFGKKKSALAAFEKMIARCASSSAKLVISYSDNSIVDIHELEYVIRKYYDLKIIKVGLDHSNQGRRSSSKVNELLFVCSPKGTDKQQNLKNILSIKPEGDNDIGLLHNYMARKPGNIVAAIIDRFSKEGDIVFDPMTGSGTTIIEAVKNGRRAVGCDINPVAYEICKVSLNKWNLVKLQKTIDMFLSAVEKECLDVYEYWESGSCRIIERCHFNFENGKMRPTRYWYYERNGEKLSKRKIDDANINYIDVYEGISTRDISVVKNDKLIHNSRIAIKEGYGVYDYFCKRNLIALDKVLQILSDFRNRNAYGIEAIQLAVSSAVNLIKLSDRKASSQMPYWLPLKDCTSRNAVFVIKDKMKALMKSLSCLEEKCVFHSTKDNEGGVHLFNCPVQDLSMKDLPDESVDLILTDPPYADQVPYLEYSQLWNLIFRRTENIEFEKELVVSDAPIRNKRQEDFYLIFRQIIRRISRALKQEGFFIMFYHSYNLKEWSNILDIMHEFGLKYYQQIPTISGRKSFKTAMSPKCTLDGNNIVVFRKTDVSDTIVYDGSLEDAVHCTLDCARALLMERGYATTGDMYDYGLLDNAAKKGYLKVISSKYSSFDRLLKDNFVHENGYWRIR